MTTPRQRLERDVLPYFILASFFLVPICVIGVFIAWLLGYDLLHWHVGDWPAE